MKFSEKWLREWVDPVLTTDELTELLTMGGMEVDSVAPAAADFSGVVVARIVDTQPHPDADKLQLCKVDCGAEELVNIVCGAANAREGLVTVLATVGAVLPGNFKIKKAKLRGVESFGMLCSVSEIGLENMGNSDGIIELSNEASPGQDLRDYLDLNDKVIELDLTPNRGDCFSIQGVARDVAVLSDAQFNVPEKTVVKSVSNECLSVEIQAPEGCPNYVGRLITGLDSATETPLWMSERLRRSGLRLIHPVVDVTNYVMMELGQPMHAFDLAKLEGGVVVRFAQEKEKLTLLDEQKIEVSSDSLVIADQKKTLALAGVMGGLDSSVSEDTTDIFLESAFFTPQIMAGKARRYKAQTDSSQRFERGVDYRLQKRAIERATVLIQQICGGVAGKISVQCSEQHLPEQVSIRLRRDRISRMLGETFDDEYIERSLTQLGMSVVSVEQGWDVTAPEHRFDIEIEADLIEEVARVKGYDTLPVNKPKASMTIKAQQESLVGLDELRSVLVSRGYQEAMTYSFVEPKLQAATSLDVDAVPLANPISSDMAVMRTSLLPGMLQALQYNLNRQHDRLSLFETGMTFMQSAGQLEQKNVIAGIVCGNRSPEQWDLKSKAYDFFDLKNDVQALLVLSQHDAAEYRKTDHPALHPGQSAELISMDKQIGMIGMISPVLLNKLDLDNEVGYFEIDLDAISQGRVSLFAPLSKFPLVRRDISLLIDKELSVASIFSCIETIAPETLKNLQLFDVYHGEGIDSVKKSVTLALTFQGTSSTLVDQDIDSSRDTIIKHLEQDLGAALRA